MKVTALVLHEKYPTFGLSTFKDGAPKEWIPAATAQFDDIDEDSFTAADGHTACHLCELLFQATNSIDAAWHMTPQAHDGFTLNPKQSLRSTSVGDVIIFFFNGKHLANRCAACGWTLLDNEQLAKLHLDKEIASAQSGS